MSLQYIRQSDEDTILLKKVLMESVMQDANGAAHQSQREPIIISDINCVHWNRHGMTRHQQ